MNAGLIERVVWLDMDEHVDHTELLADSIGDPMTDVVGCLQRQIAIELDVQVRVPSPRPAP